MRFCVLCVVGEKWAGGAVVAVAGVVVGSACVGGWVVGRCGLWLWVPYHTT